MLQMVHLGVGVTNISHPRLIILRGGLQQSTIISQIPLYNLEDPDSMASMSKTDTLTQAIAAFYEAGGAVTICRPRKALNHKTFGRRGARHHAGAKQINLRDAQGFSKR